MRSGMIAPGCITRSISTSFSPIERRRCERSHDSVLLMRADLRAFGDVSERHEIAALVMHIFSHVTRETDIKGWHVSGAVVGIMFTQLAEQGKSRKATVQRIINKCADSLRASSDRRAVLQSTSKLASLP